MYMRRNMEGLYSITTGHLPDQVHKGGSLQKALVEISSPCLQWRFQGGPERFWKHKYNQMMFMEWMGKQLQFTQRDWYKVKVDDFVRLGGGDFLQEVCKNDPAVAVSMGFPMFRWKRWGFQHKQEQFMKWLGMQLSFSKMEDWYSVTAEDFQTHHGGGFLRNYNDHSPSKAVMRVFSSHPWLEWRFAATPKEFFSNTNHQKRYTEWLGTQLKFTKMEDWYSITGEHFHAHHGGGYLRNYHDDSPSKAVMTVFPAHPWLEWKFSATPNKFFSSTQHQERFMEWLGTQLKFTSMEDWYSITAGHFHKYHGGGFLTHYHDSSPSKAVMRVFPSHPWLEWKFTTTPKEFFSNTAQQKRFMNWLGIQLKYSKMEDWYSVTGEHFYQHHGGGLLANYFGGSTSKAVMRVFSDHPWLEWRFHAISRQSLHNPHIQRHFIQWAGAVLFIRTLDGWYTIRHQQLASLQGFSVLQSHKTSFYQVLTHILPHHPWDWTCFQDPLLIGKSIWKLPSTHQQLFRKIAHSCNVQQPSDWYNITQRMIKRHKHGSKLLQQFKNSMSRMLTELIPEMEWDFQYKKGRSMPPSQSIPKYLQHILGQIGFVHNINMQQ